MNKGKIDILQIDDPLNPLHAAWNKAILPISNESVGLLNSLDFSRLNAIFATFQQVLGVSIALIDLQGKVLASSKWQRLCLQFHRQHNSTLLACQQSDTELATQLLKQQDKAIYNCLNGLVDCAAPIYINGQHAANLFIGQFFTAPPDLAVFKKKAQELQVDSKDYLAAVAEVPIIAPEKVQPLLELISVMAQYITELSVNYSATEQMLQQVEQQVASRTHELQMQNHILSMISQDHALGDVLQQLVRQIEQLYPDLRCAIALFEKLSSSFHTIAAPSLPPSLMQAIDQLDPTLSGCAVNSIAQAPTVIIDDLQQEPNWQSLRPELDNAHIRASCSVTIKDTSNQVLGIMYFFREQPGTPVAAILEKMQLFTNLAELAISRAISANRIQQMAFYDDLTGLANRRLLEERLQTALKQSKRNNSFGGLLFIDLNNFKPVNDRYGHKVGDLLLVDFAHRLNQQVREVDTVARLGGDEFVILLAELSTDEPLAKAHAQQLADKISQALSVPFVLKKPTTINHICTGSIGITLFHGHNDNSDEVLRRADIAMYQAKHQQQNICWFQQP